MGYWPQGMPPGYTPARAGYLDELAAANMPDDLDHTHDAVCHVSGIFPANTNLTLTFTANATANAWSAWAEITDSGANTLSALFAAADGHISSLCIETLSEDDTLYMIEIAYGSAKTIITRGRFAGATKFESPTEHLRFWAPAIPAGETVYYRMKTATSVADTITGHMRYHTH